MIDLIESPKMRPISSNMAYFQNDDLKGTCLQISFAESDDLVGLSIKQLNHHVQIQHHYNTHIQFPLPTQATTG